VHIAFFSKVFPDPKMIGTQAIPFAATTPPCRTCFVKQMKMQKHVYSSKDPLILRRCCLCSGASLYIWTLWHLASHITTYTCTQTQTPPPPPSTLLPPPHVQSIVKSTHSCTSFYHRQTAHDEWQGLVWPSPL